MWRISSVLYGLLFPLTCLAIETIDLPAADIDIHDQAALQRGAKMYMNYCAACHSLQYLRYRRLGHDLGLHDESGKLDKQLLAHLQLPGSQIDDTIKVALPTEDAKQWFGMPAPDLTLVAKVRGADWLYHYLLGFYSDDTRPFGSNNWLYPDVAMPNILEPLQGEQTPIFRADSQGRQHLVDLQLLQTGQMDEHQFAAAIHDLVTFLVYAAEPVQIERIRMGKWVISFLLMLLFPLYLLQKDYWRRL